MASASVDEKRSAKDSADKFQMSDENKIVGYVFEAYKSKGTKIMGSGSEKDILSDVANILGSPLPRGTCYYTIEQNLPGAGLRRWRLHFLHYETSLPVEKANPHVNDFILRGLQLEDSGYPMYGSVVITVFEEGDVKRSVWMTSEDVKCIETLVGASRDLPKYPWEGPPGGPNSHGFVWV